MTKGGSIILRIYFTLVAFVTLMILIFSVSDLVNITLKTYVFTAADRAEYPTYCDPSMTQETCDQAKQRDQEQALIVKQQSAVRDIALLVVAGPLFWLHWRIVYRDWMGEREDEKKK